MRFYVFPALGTEPSMVPRARLVRTTCSLGAPGAGGRLPSLAQPGHTLVSASCLQAYQRAELRERHGGVLAPCR